MKRFTLIELLVVIAMISILITLLLPHLEKSRQKIKTTVCATNLQSVGTAMALLGKDNNGKLPGSSAYNMIGKQGNLRRSGAWGGTTPQADRPLNKYINNAIEVAHCPSDKGDSTLTPADCFTAVGSSYMYAYFSSSASYKYGIEHVKNKFISSFSAADKKIIAGDAIFYGNRKLSDARTKWHSNNKRQMNILFLDGHVEFFNFPLAIEGWGGIPIDPDRGWH